MASGEGKLRYQTFPCNAADDGPKPVCDAEGKVKT